MDWNDRYKSPEVKEHISEMFYLLNFFALTQLEQWKNIPDEFSPAWVDIDGSCHSLNIMNNKLTRLPKSLGKSSKLKNDIYLHENPLIYLPDIILQLPVGMMY